MITYADTYHWNYGKGQASGGTISLKNGGGETFIDLLNRALKDVDSSVRKSAATILGFIWRQKGHRFSVEALNDENAMVWRGAAEALANIE
jgi:HEAT repeat protein